MLEVYQFRNFLDLDYVTVDAREVTVRIALSNSLGFGGHNVSLLIGQLA